MIMFYAFMFSVICLIIIVSLFKKIENGLERRLQPRMQQNRLLTILFMQNNQHL